MITEDDVRNFVLDVTNTWDDEAKGAYREGHSRMRGRIADARRAYGRDVPVEAAADMIVDMFYDMGEGYMPLVPCTEREMARMGRYNGFVANSTGEGAYQYEYRTPEEQGETIGHEFLHMLHDTTDDGVIYSAEREVWQEISRSGRYDASMRLFADEILDVVTRRGAHYIGNADTDCVSYQHAGAAGGGTAGGHRTGHNALAKLGLDLGVDLVTWPFKIFEGLTRGYAKSVTDVWGIPFGPGTEKHPVTDKVRKGVKDAFP